MYTESRLALSAMRIASFLYLLYLRLSAKICVPINFNKAIKRDEIEMNVNDAVETRKSIRAFLEKPVPLEILQEILRSAFRAPSWGNTQPGKVTVGGGEIFQTIPDYITRILAT
jgi:hypothetical protein